MPLENTLNVSPYFDDYDQDKEFYRILFKPGVAVQTRELNQLQTILQDQIERFGNHVFKSGTIISGVNFSYLSPYSFVKILDEQQDGQPSLPSSYVGYFIKNSLNLTARILNYEDGLESKTPNLKTLYLQYTNSSDPDGGGTRYTTFANDQLLTVFSKDNELFDIDVVNGGQGFSNSDNLIIQSAITISGNSIAFSNTEQITQATTGAKATIHSINTTAIANTIILGLRPLLADLANTSKTEAAWTFQTGYNITGGTSGATANVVSLIGSGATGVITTDSLGIILDTTLTDGGSGYDYLPVVTVQTSNATATVSALDIIPQNYKAKITVAPTAETPVGNGYAFAVTEGIIYQKGFFLRVEPQVIVIDKYTTQPDDIAVGFKTVESYVNYNSDNSLYDNATGTINFAAPGADRLKLTPVLTTLSLANAAANIDFFALAEWKQGKPYKENRTTVYNTIGDEMARRTREAQGNFVADPFEITTKEKDTANTTVVEVVIDPGLAYISGYRVATSYNNYLNVARSTTTTTVTNQQLTANYGNFIYVNELIGLFDFKAGATVSLRDTAATTITSKSLGATISAPGAQLGTARMRSLVLDSGLPGTASAVYRLYLFDVEMSAGKSFRDIRSVYYDGSAADGVADVVLTTDATTASSVAVLNDAAKDRMVFSLGSLPAAKTVTGVSYTFRTVSDTTSLDLTTAGLIGIDLTGTGHVFPYGDGTLSDTQKRDFVIFPVVNAAASAVISGTVNINASNGLVTGTSTSFASVFAPGDFVQISNSTVTANVYQISTVTNNTVMHLTTTPAAAVTSGNATPFFPNFYPIPFEGRSGRTITISSSGAVASINVGTNIAVSRKVVVAYNRKISAASQKTKTILRDRFVKIRTANNVNTNTGPWSLGIPGIARLKNVYIHDDTGVVNTSSTDVTKYFYIDNNDDENIYRPAALRLADKAAYSVNATSYMLVKFDLFDVLDQGGYFAVDSYTISDTANLASSTSTINSLEIPELITRRGDYIDLRDALDFRPYANLQATLTTTVASATINPPATVTLTSTDKLFPLPDSAIAYSVEYYNARVDTVTVDKNGEFKVVQGTPSLTAAAPPLLSGGQVVLSHLFVPPYPSIPATVNSVTQTFLGRRLGNSRGIYDGRRTASLGIVTKLNKAVTSPQPMRYTMADIGKLERRINELEYAVSLSIVEARERDRVIPSAITPTVNRFKNAFFVESFNDYEKSSVQNREFSATIDLARGQLKPRTNQLNYQAKFDRSDATTNSAIVGSLLLLPFTEETLVQQTVRSVVATAPTNIKYVGTGTITPPSFEIQIRDEGGAVIPPTPVYDNWGISYGGAGGSDAS